MSRTHKYGVAPVNERRYNDVLYHSKAESIRASELDLLVKAGAISGWARQCQVQLGPDVRTKVDFVVWYPEGAIVEEVKGAVLADFRLVRRLWPKYGPCEMHILKRAHDKWKTEIVNGRNEVQE